MCRFWMVVCLAAVVSSVTNARNFDADEAHEVSPTNETPKQPHLTGDDASSVAAASHYQDSYGPWSAWSRCSRRCRQTRTRSCMSATQCGTSVLREDRTCQGDRCAKPILVQTASSDESSNRAQDGFKVLYHLQNVVYTEWSEWSACTRHCRTRRQRQCRMPVVCGKVAIQEDALCYVEGSVCESLYKRKPTPSAPTEENEHTEWDSDEVDRVHPLDSQRCGIPHPKTRAAKTRIIGGRPAARGRWPWQVAVLNKRREPFCGGTLIAPNWVLTAAHCVRRRLHVVAGEHNLHRREGSEQESRVAQHFVHPDYDAETVDFDIALLRLRTPLRVGDWVGAACLPTSNDVLSAGSRATILGWGKLNKWDTNGTDVLHEAEVPIVTADECKRVYDDYYISENMMCAGFRRGRIDSCAGDSGGPLLYQINGRWTIYGITSFGEGCGKQGKYGIYAKVPNFVRWIKRVVGKYT